MVQSVLSGKTQEMYMSVSVTVRKDCVKGCVKRIRIGAVTYLPPKVFFQILLERKMDCVLLGVRVRK